MYSDAVGVRKLVEMFECGLRIIGVRLESGVAQNIRGTPYGQVEEIS